MDDFDILQNGPDRPPMGTRGKTVIAVLVVFALAAAALVHFRPHTILASASVPQSPGLTPPPAVVLTAPPAVVPEPVLVGTHVEISPLFAMTTTGADFVVAFRLEDHDGSAPRVAGGVMPPQEGFVNLAVAVLPGAPMTTMPAYAAVAAAANRQAALGRGDAVSLYVAGRIDCDPLALSTIGLRVDGRQITTQLPLTGDDDWLVRAFGNACPEA